MISSLPASKHYDKILASYTGKVTLLFHVCLSLKIKAAACCSNFKLLVLFTFS